MSVSHIHAVYTEKRLNRPPMNHIEMTLACDACEHNLEECKEACLGGTCKIKQQERQHGQENHTE